MSSCSPPRPSEKVGEGMVGQYSACVFNQQGCPSVSLAG